MPEVRPLVTDVGWSIVHIALSPVVIVRHAWPHHLRYSIQLQLDFECFSVAFIEHGKKIRDDATRNHFGF